MGVEHQPEKFPVSNTFYPAILEGAKEPDMMYFPEKKMRSYSEPQNPQNPRLDVNINMFHLFIVSLLGWWF